MGATTRTGRPAGRPDHPGLLPSALLGEVHGEGRHAGPGRRSARDWAVDLAVFLLALGLGALFFMIEHERLPLPGPLVLADLVGGGACCVALWWRRRHPVRIALAMVPLLTFATTVSVAGVIAVFTVALHRRAGVAMAVTAVHLTASSGYLLVRPDRSLPIGIQLLINVLVLAVATGWGMFARARRQLVVSLGERARRAETEQQLRVEQARHLERTRIAREMHDVLAHRISLVSVHAGALEYRDEVSPEEVRRAAGVIRESAHRALEDLREILGVLRAGGGEPEPDHPQPTLADLPRLVSESRQAGMKLAVDSPPDRLAGVPATLSRAAYRIVQEGLTNARKHAPGTDVRVRVVGAPGDGLTVEVRNRLPLGRVGGPAAPGSGQGLAGLSERAALLGGRLEHGPSGDGDHRLAAWLPWPA